MSYPVRVDLADMDESYPGTIYLPGAPVPMFADYPAAEQDCGACSHPMSHAGSADPLTGDDVPQDPHTGRHDGVLTFTYAPAPGCASMEQDPWHLRCAVESCAAGSMALVIGPDLTAPGTGRHAAA